MVCVSRFNGLGIHFFYEEEGHQDQPHFHIRSNKNRTRVASVEIGTFATQIEDMIIVGSLESLDNKNKKILAKWVLAHQTDLMRAWNQARAGRVLDPIPPPRGTSP